jgi:hypothetical protein
MIIVSNLSGTQTETASAVTDQIAAQKAIPNVIER